MKSRVDRMFDLLVDEVLERLLEAKETTPAEPARVEAVPTGWDAPAPEPPAALDRPGPEPPPGVPAQPAAELEQETEPALPPAPMVPSHASRIMGRMAVGLLAAIVLVNVPLNRHGVTLATAMPDRRSLIIRDGLVVKETDDREIYVYEDGAFRWISSLEAFREYGYTWGDVNVVEDGFLDQHEIGPPLHVLLKCPGSLHIYRIEEGVKRWIVDIEAFTAAGHVWEDVRVVDCGKLRGIPDGETIPPGEGPPPQP